MEQADSSYFDYHQQEAVVAAFATEHVALTAELATAEHYDLTARLAAAGHAA